MTKGEKLKAKRTAKMLERAKRYSNMTGTQYSPYAKLITIFRYIK